jgi:hypothetical protein
MTVGQSVCRAAERWNEIDEREPLPSLNEIAHTVGVEAPLSKPGDRFERDQVDVAMYWPQVFA